MAHNLYLYGVRYPVLISSPKSKYSKNIYTYMDNTGGKVNIKCSYCINQNIPCVV